MAEWTDEQVDLLKQLHADGMSCSITGARLGRSRNAVIGKLHRLGLSNGQSPTTRRLSNWAGKKRRRNRNGSAARQDAQLALLNARRKLRGETPFQSLAEHAAAQDLAKAELAELLAAPDIVVPPSERKKLQDLEDNSCRWPYGDPQSPDFHFCNGVRVPGLPYCKHHRARAYQPPVPRSYLPHPLRGGSLIIGDKSEILKEFDTMEPA